MNLEVEAYAGELKVLRLFRDDILGAVELPIEVVSAIDGMDATDLTKECLHRAMQSIHALKKTARARIDCGIVSAENSL